MGSGSRCFINGISSELLHMILTHLCHGSIEPPSDWISICSAFRNAACSIAAATISLQRETSQNGDLLRQGYPWLRNVKILNLEVHLQKIPAIEHMMILQTWDLVFHFQRYRPDTLNISVSDLQDCGSMPRSSVLAQVGPLFSIRCAHLRFAKNIPAWLQECISDAVAGEPQAVERILKETEAKLSGRCASFWKRSYEYANRGNQVTSHLSTDSRRHRPKIDKKSLLATQLLKQHMQHSAVDHLRPICSSSQNFEALDITYRFASSLAHYIARKSLPLCAMNEIGGLFVSPDRVQLCELFDWSTGLDLPPSWFLNSSSEMNWTLLGVNHPRFLGPRIFGQLLLENTDKRPLIYDPSFGAHQILWSSWRKQHPNMQNDCLVESGSKLFATAKELPHIPHDYEFYDHYNFVALTTTLVPIRVIRDPTIASVAFMSESELKQCRHNFKIALSALG